MGEEFFNLIWKLNGVTGVPFGTGLSGEYRMIQKDCWERGGRGLLKTHSPGMCFVSKQEGGQYHHQEHLARPLEARILLD